MRIAIVGGLAALVLVALAPVARADVGPPDPARRICMGKPAGEACEIDGKAGTCQGPHPSRMYCVPPKAGEGSATSAGSAPSNPVPTAAGSDASKPAAGSDASKPAAEGNAEPAPSPGHKRGCAVADPGSAGVLAMAGLALLRRRRSRSR